MKSGLNFYYLHEYINTFLNYNRYRFSIHFPRYKNRNRKLNPNKRMLIQSDEVQNLHFEKLKDLHTNSSYTCIN